MNDDKKIVQDIFSKERWLLPLERFIQVLNINIFVVDASGDPIIHPCGTSRGEEYGCRILTSFLGFADEEERQRDFMSYFTPFGEYFEYQSPLGLHAFAIPLRVYGRIVAYMVVGPVIVGRRLKDEEFSAIAEREGLEIGDLLDQMGGVKAVSYLTVTAVLDLLAAITKDFIEIGLENRRLKKQGLLGPRALVSDSFVAEAETMYKRIHFDELLVSILDVALQLTKAEVGSIMIRDDKTDEMMIRVSRGLSDKWVKAARVKIGEGVAGIAAKKNRCFIMEGKNGSKEVAPFLQRPEITESIVMPIANENHVYGVISIHSKTGRSKIRDNSGHLVGLSKLLSTAVFS